MSVMDRLGLAVAARKSAYESGDAMAFAGAFARERQIREAADSMVKATVHEPVGKPGGPGLWEYLDENAARLREGLE